MSFALSSIYYAFCNEDDGSGAVAFENLAVGLTVLCNGTKSSKLNVGFQLMDGSVFCVYRDVLTCCRDDDGYLSEQELMSFLSSYLSMLLACSFSSTSTDSSDLNAVIADVCSSVAALVCQGSEGTSFQYFGEWYNEGGFKLIPWIELIDLNKWKKIAPYAASEASEGVVGDDGVDGGQMFSLLFLKRGGAHRIPVSPSTVQAVQQIVHRSGFINLDPENVFASLLRISQDDLVTKDLYMSMVSKYTKEAFLPFFERLFDAYDRTGRQIVDVHELACGVAVLCCG